tara:strand:- start:994 stop:1500 length:507 start_codon:yes stop_codon:yes gene_type:complete
MLRSLIIPIIFLASTQISFAASSGSGSSMSSSSPSSSSSYSNSSDNTKETANPFLGANQLISYGKFDEAHKALKSLPDVGNRAERYNLLGFTARKSGDLIAAAEYYEKALYINSKHVGTLQYQGELFITLGNIEKAEQNLIKIKKICWIFSCVESTKLEDAIQKAIGS